MTHKNYILATLLALMAAYSHAGNRTVEEAQKAAIELLQRNAQRRVKGQMTSAPVKPRLVATKQRQGEGVYYYVFSNGEGKGYSIISGDDRLPEIMGYSEGGDFSNAPEALTDMLQSYQQFVNNATDSQIAEIRAKSAETANRENIAPLMQTSWDQGTPFNDMCPVINGVHAATGCVATAVAQVLKYYNWPNELKKEIPAYTAANPMHTEMSAIPAGEKYDWENMLNAYYGGGNTITGTTEQCAAVAKLFFHVGCAFEAIYNMNATSAKANVDALIDHFGMDPELTREYYRAGHTISEWDNLLYNEIRDKRPVYYTGYGEHGGHAFVIHGYRDGLYAVNWGWTDNAPSYYDISLLGDFKGSNSMIFIQPDNGIKDNVLHSVFYCTYLPAGNIQDVEVGHGVLTATVYSGGQFMSLYGGQHYVSIGYKDENGNIVNIGEPKPLSKGTSGRRASQVYNSTKTPITLPYEEGRSYELMLIESDDKERWVPCEQRSTWCTVVVTVLDGKVTVDDGAPLTATATLAPESCGYAGLENTVNITVDNHGQRNYDGELWIYVSRDSEQPDTPEFYEGVSVAPGGTFTLPVGLGSSFCEKPGDCNVWVWQRMYTGLAYIGHGTFTLTSTPRPRLVLESVRLLNATGERVFAEYGGRMVDMDKVDGTRADYEFTVRNDGGYHCDRIIPRVYKVGHKDCTDPTSPIVGPAFLGSDGGGKDGCEWPTVTIEPGGTTTFTVSTTAHHNGVAGVRMDYWEASITKLAVPFTHLDRDGHEAAVFNDGDICYLAGAASGVRDASLPDVPAVVAVGGKGSVTIGANAAAPVSVVSASGAVVHRLAMRAGEKVTLALAPGVYAVNGRKVVVR